MKEQQYSFKRFVFSTFFCEKGKCGNGQNCARMFEHEHKHFYHYHFTHQRISIAENQTICRHCSECVSVIFFRVCVAITVIAFNPAHALTHLPSSLFFVLRFYLTCFPFESRNEICVGVQRLSHDKLNKYILCFHTNIEAIGHTQKTNERTKQNVNRT